MINNEIIEYPTGALSPEDKTEILARHLVALRHEFQTNEVIKAIVVSEVSDAEKVAKISALSSIDLGYPYLVQNGIILLLKELSSIKAMEPAQYLVDNETGLIVKALEEGDIFTPPDYIGEDGNVYPSQPKVHPKISVALAMSKVEIHNRAALLEKAKLPEYKFTLSHILNPNSILVRARFLLENHGIIISDAGLENNEQKPIEIEFGRENIACREQAINPAFHRAHSFGSLLASKIKQIASVGDTVWIGNLTQRSNSKELYYTADCWIERAKSLTEGGSMAEAS